jgi:hypothetical protein
MLISAVITTAILALLNLAQSLVAKQYSDSRVCVWIAMWVVIVGVAFQALEAQQKAAQQDEKFAKTILALTGGESYPVITPQIFEVNSVALNVWNFGDGPLTGVSVHVRCGFPGKEEDHDLGNLPPASAPRQLMTIDPTTCEDNDNVKGHRTFDVFFDMTTQHGGYRELMQFRSGPDCRTYSYSYIVNEAQGPKLHADGSYTIEGTGKVVYRTPEDGSFFCGLKP